jgi:hypothetical protein
MAKYAKSLVNGGIMVSRVPAPDDTDMQVKSILAGNAGDVNRAAALLKADDEYKVRRKKMLEAMYPKSKK